MHVTTAKSLVTVYNWFNLRRPIYLYSGVALTIQVWALCVHECVTLEFDLAVAWPMLMVIQGHVPKYGVWYRQEERWFYWLPTCIFPADFTDKCIATLSEELLLKMPWTISDLALAVIHFHCSSVARCAWCSLPCFSSWLHDVHFASAT